MPEAPKRTCAGGCGRLVDRGRCKACERPRLTANERGYGHEWQKAAKAFITAHPLCADPLKRHRDVAVPSRIVDHIIPHKGERALFWDKSNWQALCTTCHNVKTAGEGSFGRGSAGSLRLQGRARGGVKSLTTCQT